MHSPSAHAPLPTPALVPALVLRTAAAAAASLASSRPLLDASTSPPPATPAPLAPAAPTRARALTMHASPRPGCQGAPMARCAVRAASHATAASTTRARAPAPTGRYHRRQHLHQRAAAAAAAMAMATVGLSLVSSLASSLGWVLRRVRSFTTCEGGGHALRTGEAYLLPLPPRACHHQQQPPAPPPAPPRRPSQACRSDGSLAVGVDPRHRLRQRRLQPRRRTLSVRSLRASAGGGTRCGSRRARTSLGTSRRRRVASPGRL
jgi:hypothetical protein